MKINLHVEANKLINAYNLFYIINAMQVSIGLTNFSKSVYKEAKHDAWISVIIAGIATHIVMYVIIKTLKEYPSADLFGIHQDVFGSFFGKVLSIVFVFYYLVASILLFTSYIEIIHSWLFSELPTWLLASIGLILVLYGAFGGLRVVVGTTVIAFFATVWMMFLLYFPLQYVEWNTLFPIMEQPISKLLAGAHSMTFSIAGFEIVYFVYPYIKEKEKVQLYSHLSIAFTTILYSIIMVVTIIYFSGGQILSLIWPTLSFFKIVRFAFMERFEIIAVSLWIFLVFPTVLLSIWAASKGIKRMFHYKQKYILIVMAFLIFIGTILIKTSYQRDAAEKVLTTFMFYLVYGYPILLYILVKLKKKFRRSKGRNNNDEI